jgi:hypothetical protein
MRCLYGWLIYCPYYYEDEVGRGGSEVMEETSKRKLTPAQCLSEYFNLPSGEFRAAWLSLSVEDRATMAKEAAEALDVELV